MGTTSLMKPGLLPVANSDTPPSPHAFSSCSHLVGRERAPGVQSSSEHVLTTFLPEARSRQSSSRSSRLGMYSTQSASSATSASTSSVASTPVVVPVSAITPTSTPILSAP